MRSTSVVQRCKLPQRFLRPVEECDVAVRECRRFRFDADAGVVDIADPCADPGPRRLPGMAALPGPALPLTKRAPALAEWMPQSLPWYMVGTGGRVVLREVMWT